LALDSARIEADNPPGSPEETVMNPMRTCCCAAVTGIVLAFSPAALSAPVDPSAFLQIRTGQGFTEWYVHNQGGPDTSDPFAGSCRGTPALSISDALSATSASDAYDEAWQIHVGGAPFVAPNPSDLTWTTFTAGPVNVSGLSVRVQYHFFSDRQLARILVAFTNPSASAVTVPVRVPVNYGSDGGTILRHTSSGDTNLTVDDRWLVTSDSGPSDPVNTSIFYGPGQVATPVQSYVQHVFSCAGTEGVGATFDLNVPAGTTQGLMFFAGLADITTEQNTVAGAIANAALFDDPPAMIAAGLLSNLGIIASNQIVNWDLGFVPQDCRAGGTVSFSRPVYEIGERGGRGAVQIVRRGRQNTEQTVRLTSLDSLPVSATAGEDYVPVSDVLVRLPAGRSRVAVPISVVNDQLSEPTESFDLALYNPSPGLCMGNTSVASVRILDDEPVPFGIDASQTVVPEGQSAQVQISLAYPAPAPVLLRFAYTGSARPGSDYQLRLPQGRFPPGGLVIERGQTSASFELFALNDGRAEPAESVRLTAIAVPMGPFATGAPAVLELQIVDSAVE
jgi:hypothetical protein